MSTPITPANDDHRPPLLCRIGLHGHWYLDSAVVFAVDRCGRCAKPRDARLGALLDAERSLWEEGAYRYPEDMLAVRIESHRRATRTRRECSVLQGGEEVNATKES